MRNRMMTAWILFAACMIGIHGGVCGSEGVDSNVASALEITVPEVVVREDMVPIYAKDLFDGTYEIDVLSSSSMFDIAKCELIVTEDNMKAVLTMGGSGNAYLKLFLGSGEEAAKASEEECISFTLDESGNQLYEVPVEALDMEIACAAFSRRKEKWYDRTLVFDSTKIPVNAYKNDVMLTAEDLALEDGCYTAEVRLEGGSGKTKVQTPATLQVKDGVVTAELVICSPHYSFVEIDDTKYERLESQEDSLFEIPVAGFDFKIPIIANSTAMGVSTEIAYTLFFDALSLQKTVE